MQRSKPATGHDVDMQGPAQLVAADRSGRRLSGLRANSLGICVMITAQMILGVGVNLYVHVPAADQGHGLATALGHALTSQPATLAAHAILGTLLLAAGVSVLVHAIRAPHRLAIAASAAGLAASTGAAASGAAFVSGSRAGASMAMAVLTGAALLSYFGILFVVRAAPSRGHGERP